MDEQKLIEIRNEIYSIEKKLIVLNRCTFNRTIWESAYHSGDLQKMIDLVNQSMKDLERLSNLKSSNQEASDQK